MPDLEAAGAFFVKTGVLPRPGQEKGNCGVEQKKIVKNQTNKFYKLYKKYQKQVWKNGFLQTDENGVPADSGGKSGHLWPDRAALRKTGQFQTGGLWSAERAGRRRCAGSQSCECQGHFKRSGSLFGSGSAGTAAGGGRSCGRTGKGPKPGESEACLLYTSCAPFLR